jgi:hypothetical protein
MTPPEVQSINAPPLWREFGLISCLLTLGMAGTYLYHQWQHLAAEAPDAVVRLWEMSDAPMVLFVALNTCAVYGIGLYLARNLAELLYHLPPRGKVAGLTLQQRVNRILAHPPAVLCGVAWGVAIAIAAQTVIAWPPGPLHTGLTLFLFCGNLMIGFAVWAIGRYWIGFLRELPHVDLNIVNLSREPVPAFLRFNSRVVMVAAGVGCLAILGLTLSEYQSKPPVILFSLYAFLVVGLTYAVPIIPLSNLLLRKKAEELDKIDAQIALHVAAASDPSIDKTTLRPLGELQQAREIVAGVRTLPPGGQISVSATAFVTGLSFLPAAVQWLSQTLNAAPPQ